jgi:hypothetical protein
MAKNKRKQKTIISIRTEKKIKFYLFIFFSFFLEIKIVQQYHIVVLDRS